MKRIILNVLYLVIITSCSKENNLNDNQEQYCGVYEGDVLLRTMIEIEDFAKCNYTEVTGTLGISDGNVQYPITDISTLSSLTKVGTLTLVNLNALTNLNGFRNITSVGSLNLVGLKVLENLDDISNLQTRNLLVMENPILQNIDALDMNFDTMNTIQIIDCPLLNNLNCFSNIKSITNVLTITNNSGLNDLYGLNDLETIGANYKADCCGSLIIRGNHNLKSINSLINLTSVKGGIVIEFNFYLDNLNGFSNMTNLEGDLTIQYNDYLSNLDGFKSLSHLDGDINILFNPLLSRFCGLKNLFVSDGHNGTYTVAGNLFNPSANQIKIAQSQCN